MRPITLPNATNPTPLPERWGELTLGQAARIAELPEGADVYSFLSVVLDLSPVQVMNLPVDFVNEQVLPVLSFASDEMPSFSGAALPATITLPLDACTKELPVPPSLDITTFGQATDLGALLQDATVPVALKRLKALAIIFYPAYYKGEYDGDQVEDFAERVCSEALMEQAVPITDFFLRATTALGATTTANSSASPSPQTSMPLASKPSWLNGMRWLWSTRWPVATKPSGTTSSTSPGA
jgi:hypothetical protein